MSDPEFRYDGTNEAVILRAAIADTATRVWIVRHRSADEFLVPEHPPYFRALKRFVEEGLEYDPVVMRRFVAEEGGDHEGSYLRELERSAEVPPNLEWHVETMAWDATRARVLDGPVRDLVDTLGDPKAKPERVMTSARAISRALEDKGRRYVRRSTELRRGYVAGFRSRRVTKNFHSYGFSAFDEKLTEGAAPKRTSLVAGLSGSGKSTFCAELAIRQARIGRRPLYCAWEMDPESMMDVMVSSITGIPLVHIVQGDVDDAAAERVESAVGWVAEHISFMENPFVGRRAKGKDGRRRREYNDDRQDLLEGYLAESGCNFVIYDLWERMLCDLSYDGVTIALYRQQAMHKEYNLHGVIVHQLRGKDVERRKDKRPTREAIKGTGAFVEVSDLILGIHREGQFKSGPDDHVEVICLKQRKGAANWAYQFDWTPETCRIRGGEEVSYDPGLDASELDAIAAIRSGKSGKARKSRGTRPGRRE